jgi:hypothetical protein
MLFAALANEDKKNQSSSTTKGKLASSASAGPTSGPKSKATKKAQYTAMAMTSGKRGLSTRLLSSLGGSKHHTDHSRTVPSEALPENENTPYNRIPQFMRNSLQLATRRKNQTTPPIVPSAGGEEEDSKSGQASALGRRRMGIADIDPYQLLRLSESVGGFSEEDAQKQQQQQTADAAIVDAGAKSPVPRRKDSKTRARPTWGKSPKV